MRNTFVFTKTRKPRSQWSVNLHSDDEQPLFTPQDAERIRRFMDPKIMFKSFTVEMVG